jgi:soluble lytic murein transglycosylase-like protein
MNTFPLLLLFTGLTVPAIQKETGWSHPVSSNFLSLSKKYSVDPQLALAVVKVESNYDLKAKSTCSNGSHSYGAFQVHSSNRKWLARDLNITRLENPRQNMKAGMYILSKSLQCTRKIPHGLMVYHLGTRRANRLASRGGFNRAKYYKAISQTKKDLRDRLLRHTSNRKDQ